MKRGMDETGNGRNGEWRKLGIGEGFTINNLMTA